LRAPTLFLPLGLVFVAAGCGGDDHPPPFVAAGGRGGVQSDGGIDVEPSGGRPGVCGEEFIPAISDPPTLYFVLDRSGSMVQPFEGSTESKYETARGVLGEVLSKIGHRVRYGAAVFPASSDGCNPGTQVFPTTQGDAPSYAREGTMGPVLSDLLSRLGSAQQEGGTPTAATLNNLRSTLTELGPRTYVVHATDGAPNCNEDATCTAANCMLNVEGVDVAGIACDADFNCCDPDNTGAEAQRWCIDGPDLVDEVSALAELGIATYVIGMPGTALYTDLLNEVAEAGGTSQSDEQAYFSADDPAALADALQAIGTGVAISCTVELEHAPEDQSQVNLYFDERLVPAEGDDGWQWVGPQTVQVLGEACNELKSGEVLELQIVYGCETVLR
jgi:hypothetical protein